MYLFKRNFFYNCHHCCSNQMLYKSFVQELAIIIIHKYYTFSYDLIKNKDVLEFANNFLIFFCYSKNLRKMYCCKLTKDFEYIQMFITPWSMQLYSVYLKTKKKLHCAMVFLISVWTYVVFKINNVEWYAAMD